MKDFLIVTDNNGDFTREQAALEGLRIQPMRLTVDGRDMLNDPDETDIRTKDFYDLMRAGSDCKTSALNMEDYTEFLEPLLAEGNDLLVMTFSSGLSSSANNCELAARELREKYPERKLLVADTLCASMGQALLVYHAWLRREKGESLETVYQWVLENRLRLCHWFTVDDLMYLKRGGRVSAATAIVGSLLSIKPVLHVDNEGHLINMYTKRGRKAAIRALVDEYRKRSAQSADDPVFISHGDCPEDAKYLEQQLRAEFGLTNIVTGYIGPVIGSHSGPGCLALFFLGNER